MGIADKVAEQLAADLLAAEARICSLDEDLRIYREMLQAALDETARLTKLVGNQRATIRRVMFGLEDARATGPIVPWQPGSEESDTPGIETMVKDSEIRWS